MPEPWLVGDDLSKVSRRPKLARAALKFAPSKGVSSVILGQATSKRRIETVSNPTEQLGGDPCTKLQLFVKQLVT